MRRERREIPVAELRLRPDGAGLPPRVCEHPGCLEPAAHRAPKSRTSLDTYYWFCLAHVRDYNESWNYFAGMSDEEVQRFQRDAVTGHRPTWRVGGSLPFSGSRAGFVDPFGLFGGSDPGAEAPKPERRLPAPQRRALAEMNLDGGATLQEIKMRYKQLVKRYHPDVNGGDKDSEERFKSITEAYRYLLSCGSF